MPRMNRARKKDERGTGRKLGTRNKRQVLFAAGIALMLLSSVLILAQRAKHAQHPQSGSLGSGANNSQANSAGGKTDTGAGQSAAIEPAGLTPTDPNVTEYVYEGSRLLVKEDPLAAPCSFTFPGFPTMSQSFESQGGTGSVSFTASASTCAWQAATNAGWVHITSAASGTGSAQVTYSVDPYSGSTPRTGAMTIAGQTFTVNQNPAAVYQGFLDAAGCGIITGWAWDANQPNTAINVDVYDGNTRIAVAPANLFREDISNAGIGNGFHGFSFTTPASLKNGVAHTIRGKFPNTGAELSNSPRSINCSGIPPIYQGFHDGAGCNTISGWAWDANDPNNPINVDIYDGTTLIATVPSIQFRPDLVTAGIGNGFHGFSFTVPASLKDGQTHSILVRFPGTTTSLGRTPRSITCTGAPPIYQGYHDSAGCNTISGWAWDRNDANSPINVAIYDGAQLVATVLAIQFRQDLKDAGIGNGYHAFVFNVPSSLKNGQNHSIRVRYSGTSVDLLNTPRTINCPP